jgi:DNA-binding transcriptional regulator GbsR (MarR family)
MVNRDQEALLERFGRYWEAQGGSRIAGKIVGWMMISDPPHQSVADIVDVLRVSHGSVSTQTRHLETVGYLERTTFPGDRTSYFVLNHNGWSGIMAQAWTGPVAELQSLATAAQKFTGGVKPERSSDLVWMTQFLLERWPGFVDEMKAYISEQSAGGTPRSQST